MRPSGGGGLRGEGMRVAVELLVMIDRPVGISRPRGVIDLGFSCCQNRKK